MRSQRNRTIAICFFLYDFNQQRGRSFHIIFVLFTFKRFFMSLIIVAVCCRMGPKGPVLFRPSQKRDNVDAIGMVPFDPAFTIF